MPHCHSRFSSCPVSRTQLLLLLALKEKFSVDNVSAFDPANSELEKSVLERLGIEVIKSNQEGRHTIGEEEENVCLFYLPHCPKQLTNNLFWANWNPENLSKLVVVSNSVGRLLSALPDRVLEREAGFVKLCADFVSEDQVRIAR
jgi:hypothetical protein